MTVIPLSQIRRILHAHPELSSQEFETQQRLREHLEQLRPERIINIGQTGLLAIFEGEEPGPEILLRADIDALPIEENLDVPYRSQASGISHKCGHDGHSAILLGVARHFAQHGLPQGRLVLLFQPAEETGEGARSVLNDRRFPIHANPDFVFALHNLPGHPLGEIQLRTGNFNVAASSLIIKAHGRHAHAGEPERGLNPMFPLAKLTQILSDMEVTDPSLPEYARITPVHLKVGEPSYGIAPGEGELHVTVRATGAEHLDRTLQKLARKAEEIIVHHGMQVEFEPVQEFQAVQNDAEAIELIREAAGAAGLVVREMEAPVSWGEDFGLFTAQYPGAMFGIGAGEHTPNLHHPAYDFPDDLLEPGVNMMVALVNAGMNTDAD